MKIALAQIDMRLGDIEGVCARIESQAILAHEQEADLLAVPVPLLAGILPGSLIEVEDFEHDMVTVANDMMAIDFMYRPSVIVMYYLL